MSTGSAESIAVSSIVAYDVYKTYFNPDCTGDDIKRISRIVIVVYGLAMGVLSVILNMIGLSLGWVCGAARPRPLPPRPRPPSPMPPPMKKRAEKHVPTLRF